MNKQKKYKNYVRKTWRQALRYNLQNETNYLCSIAMNLQPFLNVFKCFVFHKKVFLIFFIHFSCFMCFLISLFLFVILSFATKLPYSQLLKWWKVLLQKCLWQRCLRYLWQKWWTQLDMVLILLVPLRFSRFRDWFCIEKESLSSRACASI